MDNKKQQIISLLDEMDEYSLDWLLNLIERIPKKEEKIKDSTNPEAKEIWDKVCELIELELTEVSYNTWIKNIIPIGIEDNKFKLAVGNEFYKGILEGRYTKLFKNALFHVTDRNFEIEYFVGIR